MTNDSKNLIAHPPPTPKGVCSHTLSSMSELCCGWGSPFRGLGGSKENLKTTFTNQENKDYDSE